MKKLPINLLLLTAFITITSCANDNGSNDPQIITIAYVSQELPGNEYEVDQLKLNLDAINDIYDFDLKIEQKIYSDTIALDQAIQQDQTIDIALMPNHLLLKNRDRLVPPPIEGDLYTYLSEFEEYYPQVIDSVLKRSFKTEDFNSKDEGVPPFIKTFVPYSFGHLGILFNPNVYPLRMRRVTDLLSYVAPNQLKSINDPYLLNYMASIIAFEEELDQAFQLFNTETININQYQSLVASYLNSSSGKVLSTLERISKDQLIDLDTHILGDDIIIAPSHLLGRTRIKKDQPYRFEYLMDANLMYFDGFAFLNDFNLEAYSLFIDALYQPNQLVNHAKTTHKSLVGNPESLLGLFQASSTLNGLMQTNFTYYFDAPINQNNNVIFDYNYDSLLATLYPNQQVIDVSVLQTQGLTDDFVNQYRQQFNLKYEKLPTQINWGSILTWFGGFTLLGGFSVLGFKYYQFITSKKLLIMNEIKPYKVLKARKKAERKKSNLVK
jgi:hypothetical protein